MDYIIFDLEFNQGFKPNEENNPLINPKFPFEIVQIGGVKFDNNFNVISTLDMLIKPELYTVIHPIVSKLTGLTIDDLNKAPYFKDVYNKIVDFIGTDTILICWSMADVKELFRNIKYHDLDPNLISNKYINLQKVASKHFKCPKGVSIGLSNTVELLNLEANNEFHNAFNDAYYTFEVFKKICSQKIPRHQIYKFSRKLTPEEETIKNIKIDYEALYKQIEKMFKRDLTSEEKAMIKLAYMMGKTNQFIVEAENNKKTM